MKTPANFSATAWREFGALRTSTLQSARAWAIKESLRWLWDYTYVGAARTFFRGWYFWATHSRLAPIVKVARMLKAHLDNILTYLKHRVTNAMTEGLNAKIQWIKYASRGTAIAMRSRWRSCFTAVASTSTLGPHSTAHSKP